MKFRAADGTTLTIALCLASVPPQLAAQQAQDEEQQNPPAQEIEEVVAIGRQRSAAFDVVNERLEQEVVTDFLGAEQIARTGDSTVSLALRRVPGLTLVNDQFVYVRGLGERYSSALLNGAQVPSPDLTRNVIPLDIFPTQIIEALAVQKGYSPDMPAAFGGGNVNIITRGIPDGPIVSVEIASGYNSENDNHGLTYAGGNDDAIGTDDGTRALPPAIVAAINQYQGDISATGIFQALNRDGNLHLFSEAQAINRDLATAFYRDIDFQSKSLGPDGGLEVALGNRWFPGDSDQWEFGALGLLSYDNSWRNRQRVNRSVLDPENLFFETLRTTNQVSATGVVNLGLSWGGEHEISTNSLYLRNTEDESSLSEGHNVNFLLGDGRGLRNYRIRYEERELTSNQIRGRHVAGPETQELLAAFREPFLQDIVYEWYYSDSGAITDIPSEILVSAQDVVDPVTGVTQATQIRRTSTAADYRFTMLEDQVESYGWDLTKPMSTDNFDIELSFGQDNTRKARQYLQTQFGFGTTSADAVPILAGTPGEVFTDASLSNPLYGFSLNIGGIGTESYLAAQTVDGAYIKVDAVFRDHWRIAGGVRWERFRQVSLPIDQLEFDVGVGQSQVPPDRLTTIAFLENEIYPSISATFEGNDFWAETFQLRFGISETVARPDLREVSASTYIDPLTEARIQGAPGLRTAAITNFDIRAEWLFRSGANFIASLFYKDIATPIETVQGAGTDDNISLTFVNTDSAQLYGIELEWLRDLAFLGDRWGRWIEPFFVSGNLTLSDSELTVGDVGLNLSNNVRPMAQHSDYVANVQLGFDSVNAKHSWSLVYNTFAERLFFAGRGGALDAYEQPFDSIDFIYSFYPTNRLSLKFRFQNVLDSEVEIKQGNVTVLEQNVGTTAKIDLKWDLD